MALNMPAKHSKVKGPGGGGGVMMGAGDAECAAQDVDS